MNLISIATSTIHFQHMCKPKSKHTSTYVGGANTIKFGFVKLVQIISNGQNAWASNTNPNHFSNLHLFRKLTWNFKLNSYLCKDCHQLLKRGRSKAPCLVLVIETISELTFTLNVVNEIGYVHTKVEQDGTHGEDVRRPQDNQGLNLRKRRKKNKMQGLKAKV